MAEAHGGSSVDAAALLVLALVALLAAGLVLARRPLAAAVPGLAGLYARLGLDVNRTGLDFADIRTIRDVEGGVAGLVVEGRVRNLTGGAVTVPPIRFVLEDVAGADVRAWSLEPRPARLERRDSLEFRTRIAAPPDAARKVSVSFQLAAMENER